MYKNLQKIQVTQLDNGTIYLSISLNRIIDREWKSCYQTAIQRNGSYVSLRTSGAPTINKVSFSGIFISTNPFPNNEITKNEAKIFLKELDEVVGIADCLFDSLQKQKEEKIKRDEEEKRKKEKEQKDLEDFFNN